MSDPMADLLDSQQDPYKNLSALRSLEHVVRGSTPGVLASAISSILQRLVILEMYLEEEREITISREELEKFLQEHAPKVEQEVEKMAYLFFGSIATREGG